jgi:hypothetical protein
MNLVGLTHLNLGNTRVSDAGLAHFKGVHNTGVTDLKPLQGVALEDIRLTPRTSSSAWTSSAT